MQSKRSFLSLKPTECELKHAKYSCKFHKTKLTLYSDTCVKSKDKGHNN